MRLPADESLDLTTLHCNRAAGKVGGLRGHRWLLFAVESKVVIHDMVSGAAREAVRTLWDGKAPTALAFLYANAARLLGFLAGDNANEVILGPVLAVGHAGGSVALINLTTLQVSTDGVTVTSSTVHCPIGTSFFQVQLPAFARWRCRCMPSWLGRTRARSLACCRWGARSPQGRTA